MQKERKKLLKDIFMESRKYITELNKNNTDKSIEEINEEIQQESDRLLQSYLDSH